MIAIRTLFALSVATVAVACTSPGAVNAPPASPGMSHAGGGMSMPSMEPRMKAMKDMHHKMANAKTPSERQVLMADHMKAMQDGMASMKESHRGMQGMGGMGGMASMGDGQGKQAEMAKHEQMKSEHMAMMQMMMDMMAQRMPAMPAAQ